MRELQSYSLLELSPVGLFVHWAELVRYQVVGQTRLFGQPAITTTQSARQEVFDLTNVATKARWSRETRASRLLRRYVTFTNTRNTGNMPPDTTRPQSVP